MNPRVALLLAALNRSMDQLGRYRGEPGITNRASIILERAMLPENAPETQLAGIRTQGGFFQLEYRQNRFEFVRRLN